MDPAISRRRIFVAGRLLEVWDHPELPFGWTVEHLQHYAEREAWVLLFNALTLVTACTQTGRGS